MKTLYVEQKAGFGLGNFINLTPTIKKLSETHNIEVWFNDDFIRQCFIDCPFMTIINKKKSNPYLHSGMINLKNDMPDYVYVWKSVFGNTDVTEHTYVDDANPNRHEAGAFGRVCLLINGSGSDKEGYIIKKNPSNEAYLNLIRQFPNHNFQRTGTKADIERMAGLSNYEITVNSTLSTSIRDALFLISIANIVIANDSGLAHAAAAMNKKLYILWKDTKLTKNMNPSKNCTYIKKEDWLTFKV